MKFDGVKIKCFWCIKHPVISLKRKDSQTIITGDFNKVVLNKNNGYDYDAYDPSQEGKEVNGEFVIDSNSTENLSLAFYKDGKIIDSYYKD